MVGSSSYLDALAVEVAGSFGDSAGSGITFEHHGAVLRVASSDDASARCDQVESRLGRGPCVEAVRTQRAVLLPGVEDDARWPEWTEQAVQEGYVSALAMPAPVAPGAAVALNVYFREPEPWDDAMLAVARRHARTIARAVEGRLTLVTAARVAGEVHRVVEARVTVEHAVGAVMHCNACSPQDALEVLRRAVDDAGVSLEVASRIVVGVLSGAPPTPPTPPTSPDEG